MVHNGVIKISCLILIVLTIFSCDNKSSIPLTNKSDTKKPYKDVPKFNSDSAFLYIQKQVDFGPRVPDSKAHSECHDYLVDKFSTFGANVETQLDYVERYDGLRMRMKNIIATYNPNFSKRILLCAHWDSRYLADNDSINIEKPIDGANDGGSGVGVLLEIARQISLYPISIGVDIILFDVEDQGQPNNVNKQVAHTWCLGSQYWSRNPHEERYFADYGILLDMVGGKDAKFTKEGISRKFASRIVDKVWGIARKNGFSNFFVSQETPPIIDDHLYINNLIHIPTINIVEYNDTTHNKFNAHHHKHSDNMDIISKKTLHAVGQTVLEVLYSE